MAGRLAGKVAVVTGAAPRGEGVGNGMATAILFAREGAKVVLVNRSAERADKLARQIKDEGGEASVFAGDVAQADAAEAMAAFAVKTYGRLDILHNNVGVGAPGTPETVTPADWHKVLEANLTTTMLCTKYCIPR
ncbi:MAG: SDR family NAD(P)-dependent oxidoreductase [Rhodospirillales bacterium]|nr:SDR family NAD(P)-dependent oxidoreductase [Rhodospirillales bacterium]